MNEATDDKAANSAEHENRNILVCDDGVGKADEQAKQQTDKPARPAWQLNTTNDEANGEATGKRPEQGGSLVRERHGQHQADIERSKYKTSDQTQNDFRHADGLAEVLRAHNINETEVSYRHRGRARLDVKTF